VEEAEALGSGAFAEHPFFARLHYGAGHLRAGLLRIAVNAVCKRRGYKARDEKDQSNDYQQEKH
jgi:hypothetical protein